MNNITIPASQRHLLKRERKSTDEYKAQIRFMIENSQGRILKQADFEKKLGTKSAFVHVNKLMKYGYITRKRVKGQRGRLYSYSWHAEPLDPEVAAKKNGNVIVSSLNLPELPLNDRELTAVKELLLEWLEDAPLEHITGAVLFHKWMRTRVENIKGERQRILEGK